MQAYICEVCGYVYHPEVGDATQDIKANTKFEDLPDDWICPLCNAFKNEFSPFNEEM